MTSSQPAFNLETQLHPYIAAADHPIGAIIICPGGAYGGLAEYEGEPIALWLNTLGISAFVLKYRVSPHKHPAALYDVQQAIRLVREQAGSWNIDPNRVGVLGFSAGGHLASMAATQFDMRIPEDDEAVRQTSCRPDLIIACYPVISFGEYRNEPSMINLLGDSPSEELLRQLSSELQVTNQTPPAFLWHTADDKAVPVENSLLFALALSKHKVPFDLHIYESGPHGMGLATENDHVGAWKSSCVEWLKIRKFIPSDQKKT
ncbi:alpha/beta hydrolase [Paenibacillus sinopodophylli]|uniref:alpha/beta hydrolase n=1 Tax=Paenibacillus sinopodophylli TaxID=1837342 RepID=UPI00110D0C71|nr:alpha/beta hydrolase [Paenibacillus sinopodophylli]